MQSSILLEECSALLPLPPLLLSSGLLLTPYPSLLSFLYLFSKIF
ncbi:hypothetical protein AVDCRST_MAG94-6156 [uncultured Leptolyngbya sp.]|uniref:Uncharacterized protein n=1 Tax=uncultured Leptolyngbya sp. TaxID=332963 RepID=A0A6J4P696_9CYAN|nr:hypothetical protein AVDCRST_MAG94-6156 [uncultured Leptolyngbya sp.]